MKIALQSLCILFFYLLGMGISMLIGGVVPGSVIGMILLFAALVAGWVKPGSVDRVAGILTGNMVLFFLPASVGVMSVFALLGANWVTILATLVVSTVLVIVSVALTQQRIEDHDKKSQKKH